MTKGKPLASAGLVMIVEDDPLLSQDMADAIKEAGAKRVQTFSTVADALTAFEKYQPAVLVLDVNLADRGDGWALAESSQSTTTRWRSRRRAKTSSATVYAVFESSSSTPPVVACHA